MMRAVLPIRTGDAMVGSMTEDRLIVYPDADGDMAALLSGPRLARLEALGAFTVHRGRPEDEADYLARIDGAAGLLLGWDLPAAVMAAATPPLEIVAFTGIGVGSFVDLGEAQALGVTVCNTPGYADNAVAEHALALLLAVARQVPRLDRLLREGVWDQSHSGFELGGKTLGIVGYGGIGARMAALGRALGMNLLIWTRHPAAHPGVDFTDLDDLLARSDVVSLHAAATAETRHMLDGRKLDLMKREAVLINTARGDLVDEEALIARLADGRLAAAGLDVYGREPLGADHPLLALDNVVCTPHMGYSTPQAIAAILDLAIDALAGYFAGSPVNRVMPP